MNKSSLNWKEKQGYLFDLIRSKISKNRKFTDVLEEDLGISTDAVYRRLSGITELKLNELCILCNKYNISMDEILGYIFGQQTSFTYSVIDTTVTDSYMQYFRRLHEMLSQLSQFDDKELFFTASDIPFYHFLNYPELMYFKLYVRYNIFNNPHIPYRDFCEQLKKDSIMPLCKQVADVYMQIPTTEIWSAHTISKILQSLKYCIQTKCFENKETVILLLNQLSNLIDTIKEYANNGKSGNKQTPFSMYISPLDIENTIILARRDNKFDCDLKLFTTNGFLIDNASVCSDIHKEVRDLILKSKLISIRLEQERCQFFQITQDKISCLIKEIPQLIH
jgi:hypothetical protein